MHQIPNFPSNRETKPNRGSKPEPKAVVSHPIRSRKSVAGNVQNIGNGLFEQIILPALKDMIYSFFSSGARMLIFGQDDNYQQSGYGNRPMIRRSYNEPYRGSRTVRGVRRPAQQQVSYPDEYQDIVFTNIEDAKAVLGKMMSYCVDYGSATLGDLYSFCNLDYNYTHQRYGWTDLQGTRIEPVNNGFIIGFPELIFFN